MFKDLAYFVQERFPLKASLPLTLILFGAPASLVHLGKVEAARGLASTFVALLVLRIVDDLSDINRDALTDPARGTVSGRIDTLRLKQAALLGVFLLFVLNSSGRPLLVVSMAAAYYAAFYVLKPFLPYGLHPPLVNAVFPAVFLYAASLDGGFMDASLVLLALFVWCAVVAHDYAHSIHGPYEGTPGVQSFPESLGSEGTAVLASLLFLSSAVLGFLFWWQSGLGPAFPLILACTSLVIAWKCARLLRRPVRSVAREFYITGFIYFMAPLAVIPLEEVLG